MTHSQPAQSAAKKFDSQYSNGRWDYLDSNADELRRSKIIAGILRGDILDAARGVGTLLRFLEPIQQKEYFGIDVSSEAISRARQRNPNFNGLATDLLDFNPGRQFQSILINEALYYMDVEKALDKVDALLRPSGKLVISMSDPEGDHPHDAIWARLSERFVHLEAWERRIDGTAPNGKKVTWIIRSYKKK